MRAYSHISLLCSGSVTSVHQIPMVCQHTFQFVVSYRRSEDLPHFSFSQVLCLMVFRIWMLGGDLPHFGKQDNPASFADSLATRVMTYAYLAAFNTWLLLSPNVLCYDWQIGSIPLVESLWDVRNLATLVFFIILILLVFHCILSLTVKVRSPQRKYIFG